MAPQSGGHVLDTRSAGWNSVCYKISLSGYQRCGDDGPRSCNGGPPKLPPPCIRKSWDMEHEPILQMGTYKMKQRYAYHKPFTVKFPDKCKWQNKFQPEGLVWYMDGSKTNKGTGAGLH